LNNGRAYSPLQFQLKKEVLMNGQRTNSILERAPKVLAVTAASYGLTAPDRAQAQTGQSDKSKDNAARRTASASAHSRTAREPGPRAH
jgi:hypothetical protein